MCELFSCKPQTVLCRQFKHLELGSLAEGPHWEKKKKKHFMGQADCPGKTMLAKAQSTWDGNFLFLL